MTNPSASSMARPVARAQTLPLQRLVNGVVRGLLCTPVVSRVVGKRLVTVYLVGRKSGRRYAVPVAYCRVWESVLVASQFTWARNFRTGEPVEIRLAGRRRHADVRVLTDESDVVELLAMIARDNHQFAKFNRIGLDQNGNPLPDDLHLAWAAGTRVAVLTPR